MPAERCASCGNELTDVFALQASRSPQVGPLTATPGRPLTAPARLAVAPPLL